MTGHWLADPGQQPETPGPMRFFVQPHPAAGAFTQVGLLRRRNLAGYVELEYEFAVDGGSLVGILYWIPEYSLVATSFGTTLQPVRRLIDRGREQLVAEFDRSRPTFMTAIRNGLNLAFDLGGFHTYEDKADSSRKVLLAFRLPDQESKELLAGRNSEACNEILAASLRIWFEVQQPVDAAILVATGPEWDKIARDVGKSAKWLIENLDDLEAVLELMDIG